MKPLAARALRLAAILTSLPPLAACPTASAGHGDAAARTDAAPATDAPDAAVRGDASDAAAPTRFGVALDDLETIGPFASWANARSDYGAVGDGVADDAPALQRALDELGQPGRAAVLYLPAGNYRIASTLRWSWHANVGGYGYPGLSLIGESPATTTITWAGPAGGAMLVQNGSYNTRYSRLTWDGRGTAGFGIAHWWNDHDGSYYDGSSEDTDEVFKDMAIGIMAGRLGADFGNLNSEGQVRRVTFLRNTFAGLDTGSFNALDWWVWDSHFVDCARGVANTYSIADSSRNASSGLFVLANNAAGTGTETGAGGFYVYRSLFERSTVADANIGNTGWFAIHESVSLGSRRFFQSEGAGANAAAIILEGNRVVEPTDAMGTAVVVGALGPAMLIDNQIRGRDGVTGPAVLLDDFVRGRDALSIGNAYTVATPIAFDAPDPTDRLIALDDRTVAAATIATTPLALAATPARSTRTVFEVTPVAAALDGRTTNDATASLQAAIDAAAASAADDPIVHLPPAYYDVAATLVVPAGRALQIVGDGGTSAIRWHGAPGGTVFELRGPSRATLRDVQVFANGSTAVHVTAADQPGGRVFIEGSVPGAVAVRSLLHTQVTAQANPGFNALTLEHAASFVAMGTGGIGPVQSTGGSNGLLSDTWYEGPDTHLYRMDSGTFTYVGGEMAPATHSCDEVPASDPAHATCLAQRGDPAVLLDGFAGTAAFIGFGMDLSQIASGVGIAIGAETPATHALFLGCGPDRTTFFQRTAAAGGDVGLLLARTYAPTVGSTQVPNAGDASPDFLRRSLAQLRSLTWDTAPYAAPPGATDVRIYRFMAPQSQGVLLSAD